MTSRRWIVTSLLFGCTGGLAIAVIFWPEAAPGIVHELRGLPEVARVDYSGPNDAALTVVHLRDWHFVPKDLAELEGLDYSASLDKVALVQTDEVAIARFLIRRHGLRVVFSEGLSKETMSSLTVRVDFLGDMEILAKAGKLDADELRQRRELALTVGPWPIARGERDSRGPTPGRRKGAARCQARG